MFKLISCLIVLLPWVSISLSPSGVSAQQCGSQAGGAKCANNLCCTAAAQVVGALGTTVAELASTVAELASTITELASKFGYCGTTGAYCGDGCQTTGGGGSEDISMVISRDLFEQMLKHRNDAACLAKGFYTYDAFITAAKSFSGFGTTGDLATQKREIAAFLGQTSHETTGGRASAPDGPYAWGYCFKQEQGNPGDYCVATQQWPCAPGKKYYGRGPIQISYNYNYGPAGKAINYDLLGNPDAVATDPVISFKTALWFWMTPQSPKPSCHSVITGQWTPSSSDTAAGRVPGYGVITNIINGGIECGKPTPSQVQDRIGFFKRYCDLLQVGYGNNLDCANQRPYA